MLPIKGLAFQNLRTSESQISTLSKAKPVKQDKHYADNKVASSSLQPSHAAMVVLTFPVSHVISVLHSVCSDARRQNCVGDMSVLDCSRIREDSEWSEKQVKQNARLRMMEPYRKYCANTRQKERTGKGRIMDMAEETRECIEDGHMDCKRKLVTTLVPVRCLILDLC